MKRGHSWQSPQLTELRLPARKIVQIIKTADRRYWRRGREGCSHYFIREWCGGVLTHQLFDSYADAATFCEQNDLLIKWVKVQ